MEVTQHFLTRSACYQAGRTIVPKGIMVHSTGVAQPDPAVFLRLWDTPEADACVHAIVHQGGVIQTLPWTRRAWHAGSPRNGGLSANNTHIAFEILEPKGHTYQGGAMVGYDPAANAAYFAAVYQNAVELAAELCRQFSLDPTADIVDHQEGCQLDIASNHADVMHWFPRHGKSMDTFRADVAALLKGEEEDTMEQSTFDVMLTEALARRAAALEAQPVSDWAKEAWEAAVAAGIFDGTKPQASLTREQAAAVLARMGKLK